MHLEVCTVRKTHLVMLAIVAVAIVLAVGAVSAYADLASDTTAPTTTTDVAAAYWNDVTITATATDSVAFTLTIHPTPAHGPGPVPGPAPAPTDDPPAPPRPLGAPGDRGASQGLRGRVSWRRRSPCGTSACCARPSRR